MNLEEWESLKKGQIIYSLTSGTSREVISVDPCDSSIQLKAVKRKYIGKRTVTYFKDSRSKFLLEPIEEIARKKELTKVPIKKIFVRHPTLNKLEQRRVQVIEGKQCVVYYHTVFEIDSYIEGNASTPGYYTLKKEDS